MRITLYIGRRLIASAVMLLALASALFVLVASAPGDPLQVLTGGYAVSPEFRAAMNERFGLGLPLWERYLLFMKGIVTLDLGDSFSQGAPVLDVVVNRLGATMMLVIPAFVISTLVGTALGVYIGTPTNPGWLRGSGNGIALALYSTPSFYVGQLLILLFALSLSWFPVSGMRDVRAAQTGVWDIVWHAVLPIIALSLRELGLNARVTQGSLRDTLSMEYMVTARSKGLKRSTAVRRHGLRNAMMPVITTLGYNFGALLAGSVLVEVTFGWPGIGRLMLDAIQVRDTILLIACAMAVGLIVVMANLVTDLIYTKVDPRVRTVE
ncbi:ABC transporter permease [Nocardioides sp. NPDC004968]|uniref:ABC transporter permease n=1 Tax=Nocardioides sp. NPDC004968 TaxID=3155894 RepID=UPI0033B939EE